jgi:hypothetical protein
MWTKEDETQFQEMLQRRQTTAATLRECLRRAVQRVPAVEPLSGSAVDEMVDHLVANAEGMRKVLEPFDPSHPGFVPPVERG